ncbi:MAG TPA: rhomboid family intramembrane serine protease [Solirubrobacterales bacterium]
MLPLRDNLPTDRFPVLTVVLIAINVIVFGWMLTLGDSDYASPELRELGIAESDQASIEYGAIPYRLTHPGEDCGAGAVPTGGGGAQVEVVCEGTEEYDEALSLAEQGVAPLAPLADAPWWVTVFTSMFMHGSILHIAGNMLFLWVFGNNIEDSMGRPKFLAFYLLSGIVAVYAQTLLEPGATVPTIGASGAVAGVLGGYILLHPHARVLTLIFIVFFVTFIEIPAMVMLGIWFVLQLLPAVGQVATTEIAGDGGGIAYLAHVGGFAFGLATIKLWATRRRAGPGETGLPSPRMG